MGRLLMMMVMARTMTMLLLLMPKGTQAVSTCVAITPFFSRVTYVTCHFDRDISNLGFNVRFFPVGGGNAETALACDRLNSGRLTCTGDNSVNFDKNQTNRYWLSFMRDASMNKPGSHYQCQEVPPSGGEPAERCTVVQIDIPEAEAASTTPTPKPILPGNTDDAGKNSSMDILLLILFLLFVIAIVVGCVVVFLRKERITKWWAEHVMGVRSREDKEDPEKSSPQKPSASRIPDGWPTYFYNLGWRDRGSETITTETETSVGGTQHAPQSPRHKQISGQEANQTSRDAAATDPLLASQRLERSPGAARRDHHKRQSERTPEGGQHEMQDLSSRGAEGARAPRTEGPPAGHFGAAAQESPETDVFYDANTQREETKTVREAREKYEKAKGKGGAKEQAAQRKYQKAIAIQRAKDQGRENIEKAKREADQRKADAKGKPAEEQKEAKKAADAMVKEAETAAKQLLKEANAI